MNELTFAQPHWFWVLAAVPILLILFFRNEQMRRALIRKLVAARLEDRLAGTVNVSKRRLRFFLFLAGLIFVIGTMAQPRLGFDWEESKRKGRDVLIAVDTSKSMLATDLAPDRLTRAKLAAQDLIGQLKGDRVGLIAFAGTAFLQAPLTVDYSAVLDSLNELDPEIVPQGGTNIAAAIKGAQEAFGKGESEHHALIIFTDGEDLEEAGEKAASEASIRIFTVGLGSPDGSLIPLAGGRGGDFVKDASGQIVKSRLDETRLTKIAQSTGGFYLRLDNGRDAAMRIVQDGLGKMSEHDIDSKLSRHPIERFQWPLSAGLALLVAASLLKDRKRANATAPKLATAALLAMAVFSPTGADAKNPGIEAYEREDYKGAAEQFTRQLKRQPKSPALHYDLGNAAYKSGDYEGALQSFSRAVTTNDPQLRAKAEYNLGNTLYQRGAGQKEKAPKLQEWKNAIQHYDQTLQVDPKNKDAEHNRELLKKLIAELEKEPAEPPKSEEEKKQDQKDEKDKKEEKDKKDSGDQKDQKDQKGDEKKEGEESKPGDKGDPKKEEDGKDAEQQPSDKEGKESKEGKEPPQDAPATPERKREGELKSQPEYEKEAAEEQAEEAQAAAEGKMTERQAMNLLDSLKNDDQRVQLQERAPNSKGRFLRDW